VAKFEETLPLVELHALGFNAPLKTCTYLVTCESIVLHYACGKVGARALRLCHVSYSVGVPSLLCSSSYECSTFDASLDGEVAK
jgi:hypothetical protein